MQNGYFQILNAPGGGFGIKFFPPKDGGAPLAVNEVMEWLDGQKIGYDVKVVNSFLTSGREIMCQLGKDACPVIHETYKLTVSQDSMQVTARFYPPSETGSRMSLNEFLTDLKYKNIVYGIVTDEVQAHFQSAGVYCTDFVVAKGKAPRHGKDAEIEYFFNTDLRVRPTMQEDGSVDFFHLNVINHCAKGDLLARLTPADVGEVGMNVFGAPVKPRDVKNKTLKFGREVEQSEDKLEIRSMVDGHVMLVEDKVFVSDVYEVENVDISTGNIEFNGSVQINGNVATNFTVRASGNVVINGVVEGAHIFSEGNIIIARGMNGMGKGTLEAGGNIVAKFIENAQATAQNGYISAESIMYSNVSAGDAIVVSGKRGLATGGHLQAGSRIEVKTLGAQMGARTIVEVGVNPTLKKEYVEVSKLTGDLMKEIRNAQPIITSFAQKRAKGVHFTKEQLTYITELARQTEENKQQLMQLSDKMQTLQQAFETQKRATVEVTGEVYAGTTIVIGDVSMVVQSSYKYCRFERVAGEVKMVPL
ncbi:MAG: DUF342 domain-containing protein [Lachnospiraceae bacterium]|nr:DUF342 domain-containing protein [Lachnospiraceae bacterium]